LLGRWERLSGNDRDRSPATVWPSPNVVLDARPGNAPQARPSRRSEKRRGSRSRTPAPASSTRRTTRVRSARPARERSGIPAANTPARDHAPHPALNATNQTTDVPGTGKEPGPRLISSPAAITPTTAARRPHERLSRDRTGSTRGPLTPGPRGPPIPARPDERATPHPRHNAPPPAAAAVAYRSS